MSKSIRISIFSALVTSMALGQTFNELNGHLFANWDVSVADLQMQPGDWIAYSRAFPERLIVAVFHAGTPSHTTIYQSLDWKHFSAIADDATGLGGDKMIFPVKTATASGAVLDKIVVEHDAVYLTGLCERTLPGEPNFVVDCSSWRVPYDGTAPRKLLALGPAKATLVSGTVINGTVFAITNAYPSLDGSEIQIYAVVQIPGPIPNSIFPYNGIYRVNADGSLTETVDFPTVDPNFDCCLGIWQVKQGFTYATYSGDLQDTLFFRDSASGTDTPLMQVGHLFLGEYPRFILLTDADWQTYRLRVVYQTAGIAERYHIVSFDPGSTKPRIIWDGSTIPNLGDPSYPIDIAFSEADVGAVRFVMVPPSTAPTPADVTTALWDGSSMSLLMKPGDVLGGKTIQQVAYGNDRNTAAYLGCTGWISTF